MKKLTISGLVMMIMFLVGCSTELGAHKESLVTQLEHEAGHGEAVNINITELLLEYKTVEVETNSSVKAFLTLARTDEIEKYPCSSCHETPLGTTLDTKTEPHWNIKLTHASSDVMTCTTCHMADNLDMLHTLTGTPVEFDDSYQVCAQCHSSQYYDWTGGAHGKRLEGWAEPRVVQNCANCHDPHAPAWDTRWPAVTGGIEE